ncbi:MAG: hypothetical protein C0485_00470 [Pirellula sp.]|nr:hypothetical protein [Pirellula sp.]
MRFFTDLRRGLLAASSLATLQVAVPAYAQQYPGYPQTAQPYAQAAGQNPYAALPQPTAAQPYAATQPVTTVATQPIAATAPYQQYSAAKQQVAVASQQATQQYVAATQQAAGQYNAATQYVASLPAVYPTAQLVAQPYPAPSYPAAAQAPVQAMTQPAAQPSAFQQVYPNVAAPVAQQPIAQQPVAQQQPVYQQPVYTARAMQNPAPEAVQNLPLTPPTEAVPPGAMMPSVQATGPQPVPMSENGYPQGNGGYESYPSGYGSGAGAGCATGNCAPYGAADYSSYGCEPSMTDRVLCRNNCNYWFGGVYGLLMQRDSSDKYNLGMMDAGAGYPAMPNIPVTSANVDPGYQGGIEFRLGRTFGGVGDACGCAPCCPSWGVEGVYWELFDNDQSFMYMPGMPSEYYSMMPMNGLEYNGGNGYLPLNNHWNYGPPTGAGTYAITEARVQSSFSARNIEVNFLRLNLCGCAPTCGPCGGCDGGMGGIGGGMGGLGGGCDAGGCNTGYCAPNRYNITGVCGVRYLELDDYFMYGVDYTGGSTGYLNYNSDVENKLVGFQFGSNAMYRIGCKWGVHLNSLVGLYGNDIDTHQYFISSTGMVRYASSGDVFDANASKTDVAMLGELRLGASYQATCNCRIYGGWRAMGLTGVALATNQVPNQWLTSSQGSSYVNSSGSMIIHGLQTGVEWNY